MRASLWLVLVLAAFAWASDLPDATTSAPTPSEAPAADEALLPDLEDADPKHHDPDHPWWLPHGAPSSPREDPYGHHDHAPHNLYEHQEMDHVVCVLGLGRVGRRVATMLAQARFQVELWDRNASKPSALQGLYLGMWAHDVASEAVAHCGVVLTLLPSPADALDLMMRVVANGTSVKDKHWLQMSGNSDTEFPAAAEWAKQQGLDYLCAWAPCPVEDLGHHECDMHVVAHAGHIAAHPHVLRVVSIFGNVVAVHDLLPPGTKDEL